MIAVLKYEKRNDRYPTPNISISYLIRQSVYVKQGFILSYLVKLDFIASLSNYIL